MFWDPDIILCWCFGFLTKVEFLKINEMLSVGPNILWFKTEYLTKVKYMDMNFHKMDIIFNGLKTWILIMK